MNQPRFTLPDGQPSKDGRYANVPMTRDEAYDVAISFGLETGMPIQPRPHARGFDAVIPMEYLRGLLEALGKLPL